LLSTLSFGLVYKILPYEKIQWQDAFWGGAFAAVVFEIAKFGFAWFATSFPLYRTVYGAFAILPLFLVWIYLTWWVTLAGATLVANLPIIRAWEKGLETPKL
jgi:membrane protein